MERQKFIREFFESDKFPYFFLTVMYSVGIAGHLIPQLLHLMLFLTPFTLLLTGGYLLYHERKHLSNKFKTWLIITYLVTFFLEAVGVETGLIFGEYSYGDTLGFKIFDVPLIIGFNWVLVILGCLNLIQKYINNIWLISFLVSLSAVLFDYFLEPVAINLNYWSWEGVAVPLQNYIAWFLISFAASLFYLKMKLKIPDFVPAYYTFIQLVFFLVIGLFSNLQDF